MGSSEVVSIEQGLATLKVTVDSERATDAFRRALREVTLRANIPGFRKGKAPRAVVERFVGADYIFENAIQGLVPEAYEQAMKDAGLTPIDDPSFEGLDGVNLESGDDLVFTAKVWVKPEIELMDYSSIKIDRARHEVTAEEVDNVLEQLREDAAEYVPVERSVVQAGDLVALDVVGSVDGERAERLSAVNAELTLGKDDLLPGLEEKIIGLTLGEPTDVEISLPDDYHDSELAGRKATLTITVKSIKEKQLPELNDEFATTLEGVSNLADLRDRVEHNLVHRALSAALMDVARTALGKIIQGSKVGESKLLVDRRLDKLVSEIRRKAEDQGVEWAKYLEMRGKTEEEIRSELYEKAVEQVQQDLIIQEVAIRESLLPTEREVSMTLLEMIGNVDRLPEAVIQKTLSDPALRRSAFDVAVRTAVLRWLGQNCDADPASATCGRDHSHDHDHGHDHDHDHDHSHDDEHEHDGEGDDGGHGHQPEAGDAAAEQE